jgi:hypothetical protein
MILRGELYRLAVPDDGTFDVRNRVGTFHR